MTPGTPIYGKEGQELEKTISRLREVCNGTSGQQNLTQWQICKFLWKKK